MLNSIYLSGWEYNRILQPTPIVPVVSGLPAQVLWNGAAQFWLFENVLCTKESLEGDRAGYEALGWTSGRIFDDLVARGFLKAVDWNIEARRTGVQESLLEGHGVLKEYYSKAQIRDYLERGQESELESIKLRLLSPLLKLFHCVKNVSPNSISHWIPQGRPAVRTDRAIVTAGCILSNALAKSAFTLRAGFRLCDPPGTGLDPSVLECQRQVEQKVQRPMIPALLEGTLSQKDYLAHLIPTRGVYEPVNQQLWGSYEGNVETLERLRDIARRDLWPKLHSEWFPRLEADPGFLPALRWRLRHAVLRSSLDPYLKFMTRMAISGVSIGAGAAVATLSHSVGSGKAAGLAVKEILETAHERVRKESDNLTMFLQSARSLRKA